MKNLFMLYFYRNFMILQPIVVFIFSQSLGFIVAHQFFSIFHLFKNLSISNRFFNYYLFVNYFQL